jgi:hypothetical protein
MQPNPASYWLHFHKNRPPSHLFEPVGFPPGHPLYSGPVGHTNEPAEEPRELPAPTMFYWGTPLDGSVEDFHKALAQLEADTVPESYYNKVVASQQKRRENVRKRHDRTARQNSPATRSSGYGVGFYVANVA